MLKAIFLLLLTTLTWASEEYATISMQRWNDKTVVSINHDQGWHTYWKNPGDAGIASTFKFSQKNRPLEVKSFEWPAPKRYMEAGDIMTIGYSDTQHFFFENIPGEILAHVGVLICKDICIPGEAELFLAANANFVSNRPQSPYSASELKKSFENIPQEAALPAGFEYYLTRKKGEPLLTLHYSLKGVSSPELPKQLPLLTGYPHPPLGYKRELLFYKDNVLYGKTEIEWDGEYLDPPVALPEDGKFSQPYQLSFLLNDPLAQEVKKVQLEVQNFSLATPALDQFYNNLNSASATDKAQPGAETGHSYLEYLLFAFLGGLILNLMPCVLPVISLKLFGLIKHRNYPRRKLLAHNFSYTAGVISTFMVLALVIAGLKAAGEEIGWGFQLQSPAFILLMMLILFILSLNLFGLFEFITPGGSKLGAGPEEEGFMSDFFSGVLTTILSTPCSAPFLGTALTFAFTTTYTTIFVMFFFIGFGLAFPFLLTAIFPGSLFFFPRPGAWMEKLKYFLGLSLGITVIWLYDVFVSLVNFEAVSWKLNILFALWFFAFFFAQKISRRKIAQFIVFAIALTFTILAIQDLPMRPEGNQLTQVESEWTAWSEEKLVEEKGKLIFIDFTAEWCLTCKVNKKLVLETDSFRDLAKKYNLVLMRADWTRRDDNITQFLRAHNAVGVPAYFIQKPDGKMISLGETISIDKIESYLR
jgi:thiol:disulfide interchange protein